jgi:uroporphyrin-III C-methyltransferase / precorrin-2 dehydrogenase / sirohydrochlorin ferrochelatase
VTRHVAPAETLPARLAPLAKLPIFLDLAGRRVVVAGGSAAVAWKAEMLAAAGARVTVFAAASEPELDALAQIGAITLLRRPWQESDLDGAMLAVAEEPDLAAAARARGILVNTIDQPAHCDFQFGTIVNRSPVVIGISTDGAAPILGQAIRRRIEAVLPAGLGAWTAAAKQFRARLKALVPSRTGRRRFWERFVDASFAPANREVGPGDLEALASDPGTDASVGEVVIVGAGPGDPSLVTLGAMRELQAADVIVYDRLVTPQVLELGRREARRILVGKQGHGAGCRQQDISALLLDLARDGQRVVRLKGGDPAIFGRTGEEVAACRAAGVPVRIVPGVTTASAAAASLGLSLTHRDHAQRVQFVTGHDRTGGLPDLDLDALADPRATTVVYMGRRTARPLAQHLLARGLAPTTPVVVTTDVSRAEQRQETMTLAALGDLSDGTAPTLILIGAALGLPDAQQS